MDKENPRKSQPYDSLQHGFWNINGFKSQIIGNKLKHKHFLKKIENCDIVGLAETHVHKMTLTLYLLNPFQKWTKI